MCQSIPSCYGKGESSWWRTCSIIDDFMAKNPDAATQEIREAVQEACASRTLEEFINFVQQDLLRRRSLLADDPAKCESERNINRRSCERYEKILSAFAQ